jgi:hypothetical protein
MNTSFYLTFSFGLFVIWALSILIFDRMDVWMLTQNETTLTYDKTLKYKRFSREQDAHNLDGAAVAAIEDDVPLHSILGLRRFGDMGDIKINISQPYPKDIFIPNVYKVDQKVAEIRRAITGAAA